MINKPKKYEKTLTKEQLDQPKFFKIILLNDDFTTMDFVVKILIMFLNKTKNQAIELMLKVHNDGSAVCGIYPEDIAKTIREKISNYSRVNKQPLKCIIK